MQKRGKGRENSYTGELRLASNPKTGVFPSLCLHHTIHANRDNIRYVTEIVIECSIELAWGMFVRWVITAAGGGHT